MRQWSTTGAPWNINPGDANTHCNLGSALLAKGRVSDAMASYERALAIDPRNANAHSNLGVLLMRVDRENEAITHFGAALGANPGHAEANNGIGVILRDRGEFGHSFGTFWPGDRGQA